MDFSKHNLISFGDSFTFGQGIEGDGISFVDYLEKHKPIDREIAVKNWVQRSKSNSYTARLSLLLGVNKHVNLGQMGASNYHTLYYLREFIKKNHDENNIYLVGLTEPSRHVSLQTRITKASHTDYKNYMMLESLRTDYIQRVRGLRTTYNGRFYQDLDNKFWEKYLTSFNTPENFLFNHIQNYYNLCDVLKGKKYFIFDILNDTDYQLNKMPEMLKLHTEHAVISEVVDTNLINNGFEPVVGSNSFIKDYMDHVSDNHRYFNYYKLNEKYQNDNISLRKGRNVIFKSINDYIFHLGDGFLNTHDTHWNAHGHKIVANILKDFITERS